MYVVSLAFLTTLPQNFPQHYRLGYIHNLRYLLACGRQIISHNFYCNRAIGLEIGWEFNFEYFLSVKSFLLDNDYQKLFKIRFLKNLLRYFHAFLNFHSNTKSDHRWRCFHMKIWQRHHSCYEAIVTSATSVE